MRGLTAAVTHVMDRYGGQSLQKSEINETMCIIRTRGVFLRSYDKYS
jgi:hypothetical protein